jgi:hypothetical protein
MTIHQNIHRHGHMAEGSYRVRLKSLEEKNTTYGERLLWIFEELEDHVGIAGFTSRSESTMAKAYLWAVALNPQIASKRNWSSTDVVGCECLLEVEVVRDQHGVDKNRIVSIKPVAD